MRPLGDLFRRRWLEWTLPTAFVVANLVLFVALRSGVAGRAEALTERLQTIRQSASEAASKRAELEKLSAGAKEAGESTDRLYLEQFSTESDRLTLVIWEVKKLAERSGLDLRSIGYPEDKIEDYGLVRRSFVFSVEGSWGDLRQFLHLLELTSSFIAVNEIKVDAPDQGKDAGTLRVSVRLSTIFVAPEDETSGAKGGGPQS